MHAFKKLSCNLKSGIPVAPYPREFNRSENSNSVSCREDIHAGDETWGEYTIGALDFKLSEDKKLSE